MRKLLLVGLLALLNAGSALADLTVVDFRFAGDGLLLRDVDADIEWLHVPTTQGLSYNDILANVGLWRNATFRHATLVEVCDLVAKLGAPGDPCPVFPRPFQGASLVDSLGATIVAARETVVRGWFDAGGAQTGLLAAFEKNGRTTVRVDPGNPAGPTVQDATIGNLLVRKIVYLQRVDLFAPGDELITRDPLTGLDWLDNTETRGLSFNDILADVGGWRSLGFRHATTDEVCVLMDHFGAGPMPCPEADFHDYVDKTLIFDFIGQTFAFNTGFHTTAWFDKGHPIFPGLLDVSQYHDIPRATIRVDTADTGDKNVGLQLIGNLLVRAPEPGATLSALSALAALAWLRRRSPRR